jgi:hypothetical protein
MLLDVPEPDVSLVVPVVPDPVLPEDVPDPELAGTELAN